MNSASSQDHPSAEAEGHTSEDWLERFRKVHPSWVARDQDPKFGPVFVRGLGATLWDASGHEFLDLTCGYSATNFGHAFAPFVAAATSQLTRLSHVTAEPHVGRILLAEKLLQVLQLPFAESKVVFNVSGARAIETAWKASSAFRPGKLMVLGPCYHGRSLATLALSEGQAVPAGNSKPAADHGSPWHGVLRWPSIEYPYCGVCPLGLEFPGCQLRCVDRLFEFLKSSGDSISAVLVEPAIGARGYIFPPVEFFLRLREITSQLGILMIADEVQTGLGRCGNWLLSKKQGWSADLVVVGKSLGGGIVPISATIGRADVLESLRPGDESETFNGSPLAAAVGLEVLEQLDHGAWFERGEQIGESLREFVRTEVRSADLACSIEGVGASCVIEFFSQLRTCPGMPVSMPFEQSRAERLFRCWTSEKLLMHLTGPYRTRVVMLPPLTLSVEEQHELYRRLQHGLRKFVADQDVDRESKLR